MPNLLPNNEKKGIRREYALRRIIMILILLGITGVVAMIGLFPSYVLVQQRFAEVNRELSNLEAQVDTEESQRITQQLEQTNTLLKSLEPYEDHVPFYVMIRQLFDQTPDGIRVTGVTYERNRIENEDGEKTGEKVSISINGTAATRDILTSFKSQVENMPMVDTVSLPISSIAKREDISFNMELTSKM